MIAKGVSLRQMPAAAASSARERELARGVHRAAQVGLRPETMEKLRKYIAERSLKRASRELGIGQITLRQLMSPWGRASAPIVERAARVIEEKCRAPEHPQPDE